MRALATVRTIAEIRPIEGADHIVAYRVDGWWLVDKKDQYKIGDLVVYCEVDSWIPTELAPFLSKGKEPKVFEGVSGERLHTIRLKGQLSQGLLMPLSVLKAHPNPNFDGEDVTDALGILKWEAPIPLQLAGQVKGNFPSEIPKTNQERVQNVRLSEYQGESYEVTEKLHGSSCTFYLDNEDEFHVCSRNLDLKPDEKNAYWKAAYKYNVEAEMRRLGLKGYAIQGELCGEGTNGNNYKLGLEFFAFDVYIVGEGYLSPFARHDLIGRMEIKHVPIYTFEYHLVNDTKEDLLLKADGSSTIADCKREGFVFKSHSADKTFKTVSNAWLLKYE